MCIRDSNDTGKSDHLLHQTDHVCKGGCGGGRRRRRNPGDWKDVPVSFVALDVGEEKPQEFDNDQRGISSVDLAFVILVGVVQRNRDYTRARSLIADVVAFAVRPTRWVPVRGRILSLQ